MRDIRKGLEQRLEDIACEKKRIGNVLSRLAEREVTLRKVIEIEDARFGGALSDEVIQEWTPTDSTTPVDTYSQPPV